MLLQKPARVTDIYSFAARSEDKNTQVTFLQFTVEDVGPNIAVIPVRGLKKFVDLGSRFVRRFFPELNDCYESDAKYWGETGQSATVYVGSLEELMTTTWEGFDAATLSGDLTNMKDWGFVLMRLSAGTQHPVGYISDVMPDSSIYIPVTSGTIFTTGELRYDATSMTSEAGSAVVRKLEHLAGFKFEGEPKRFKSDGFFVRGRDGLFSGHRMNRYSEIVKRWGFPNYFTQVGNTVFIIYTHTPRIYEADGKPRMTYGNAVLSVGSVTINGEPMEVVVWENSADRVGFNASVDYAVVDLRDGFSVHAVNFGDEDFREM